MPTNTTTPEAATTTTPATNTNTTPLSAMTGEEVASILVGLIRQNDGVLIQTKLENALRSTGYAAIANDMSQGKQALYTLLQSKGVTIQGNESISECCTLLNAACLTLGECVLADGVTLPDFGSLISNVAFGSVLKKVASSTATAVSTNIGLSSATKELYYPNATSGAIGSTGMNVPIEYINLQSYVGNMSSVFGLGGAYQSAYINSCRHFYGCTSNNSYSTTQYRLFANILYDVRPSGTITVSANYKHWIPETALSSASQSLCTKDKWDDENQPTFANNLQKFLWYFEYHFIPCFGDVSSLPLADRPVLTLYTTVESAINSAMSKSQPTKTLKQLLVDDKGWQVLASN